MTLKRTDLIKRAWEEWNREYPGQINSFLMTSNRMVDLLERAAEYMDHEHLLTEESRDRLCRAWLSDFKKFQDI